MKHVSARDNENNNNIVEERERGARCSPRRDEEKLSAEYHFSSSAAEQVFEFCALAPHGFVRANFHDRKIKS